MAIAMPWHFVWFKDLYHQLGIYTRETPIIPLGLLSMFIQGVVLAYLYPRFYKGGNPIAQGIKYGVIMGVYLFSVSTLANAAKIQVTSISHFLFIQAAFHSVQFIVAGALMGLVFGRIKENAV